jgi:hypothetical protein
MNSIQDQIDTELAELQDPLEQAGSKWASSVPTPIDDEEIEETMELPPLPIPTVERAPALGEFQAVNNAGLSKTMERM